MAVFERQPVHRPSAQCVRELRVPISRERLPEVRHFYRDVIGLPDWNSDLPPGGWGAGDAGTRVFFVFRHDPPVDPMRRRFTIGVQSLEVVAERLNGAEWPFREQRGLWASDRAILLTDPQGHRLEVRQFRAI